jgi:hypothetical protein
VRQAERDGSRRPGLTTDERARFKQFERERGAADTSVRLVTANESDWILVPDS